MKEKGTPWDGMTLIDTHCHLNDRQAFPLPAAAINEAISAGVARLVVVGIDTESSRYAVELAEQFEQVYAVVGWHPNHANQFTESELKPIREMLAHPKVVALGEIGLDYYRDHASRDEQFSCLLAQLDLADELDVPVVFHCRDAYDDLLDVIEKRVQHKWLFHCFAGEPVHASRASKLGSWFGVDGPVTYKSADSLRETIRTLPLDKLLIETDAPWMAPVPYRGQRNKPAWVALINEGLAATWQKSPEEMAQVTTANALAFYDKLRL